MLLILYQSSIGVTSLHYGPLQSCLGNLSIAIQTVTVPCRDISKTAFIPLALVLARREPLRRQDQLLIMYNHRQTVKVKSKTCTAASSTFADLKTVALKVSAHAALALFNCSADRTLIYLGKPGFNRTEK